VHLFPTGQGNIVGHPVEPVIKLTGNPKTAASMVEHIDLDVSRLLRREMNLREAGERLMEVLSRTINGRLTCAESLGHREFVLTRLYQSA
jgi:(2R)-sulfolactate sulfo-lyase subunit beta